MGSLAKYRDGRLLTAAISPEDGWVDAVAEITRLNGGTPPPLFGDVLRGNSRVSAAWHHMPANSTLRPMHAHVLWAIHPGFANETGSVQFIPRGQPGALNMNGSRRVSFVCIGDERLAECADSIAPGRRVFRDGRSEMPASQLYLGMKIISDEVGAAGPHGILFLEHAVDLLCVALIRGHTGPICKEAPQRGLPLWQVKRVTAYMQERLGNDITLQELADIACKSRFHFCTAFRVATGVTPYEYLTQLRMRAACTLLQSAALQVGDVAISVGYRSVSAFSTAFRRYAGTSPREFRSARAANGYCAD